MGSSFSKTAHLQPATTAWWLDMIVLSLQIQQRNKPLLVGGMSWKLEKCRIRLTHPSSIGISPKLAKLIRSKEKTSRG